MRVQEVHMPEYRNNYLVQVYVSYANAILEDNEAKRDHSKSVRARIERDIIKAIHEGSFPLEYKLVCSSMIMHTDAFDIYWIGLKYQYDLPPECIARLQPNWILIDSLYPPGTTPSDSSVSTSDYAASGSGNSDDNDNDPDFHGNGESKQIGFETEDDQNTGESSQPLSQRPRRTPCPTTRERAPGAPSPSSLSSSSSSGNTSTSSSHIVTAAQVPSAWWENPHNTLAPLSESSSASGRKQKPERRRDFTGVTPCSIDNPEDPSMFEWATFPGDKYNSRRNRTAAKPSAALKKQPRQPKARGGAAARGRGRGRGRGKGRGSKAPSSVEDKNDDNDEVVHTLASTHPIAAEQSLPAPAEEPRGTKRKAANGAGDSTGSSKRAKAA